MNNIIILAFEYLKIGAVAIGGGYTAIPFLYYIVEKYNWFEVSEITKMVAISNLTPGPIGINMATYVGLKIGNIIGAISTTIAFMIPSFIVICLIAKILKKNDTNQLIKSIFYGLRPAGIGLILYACIKLMCSTFINIPLFKQTQNFIDLISIKSIILTFVFIILGIKFKKQPMILIAFAIIIGLITHYTN